MTAKIKKLLALIVLLGAVLVTTTTSNASTPCEPLPADGRSTHTVTVAGKGSYSLWLRMLAPAAERNSVWVQIDGQCPVIVGDSQSGEALTWVGHQGGDQSKRVPFDLNAGEHTIVLAGREVGTGVDKGLLTNDLACVPVDNGDNCPNTVQTIEKTTKTPAKNQDGRNWLLLSGALLVVVGASAFLVWKYIRFRKKFVHTMHHSQVVVGGLEATAVKELTKLARFFEHHKLTVFICGILITISLIVGIAAANGASNQAFETEAGALSGSAKVVDDAKASGGKYVLYGEVPAPPAAASPSKKSSGGGGRGGGSPGGGGGGGSTPTEVCPAFPAFPDANCTGWEHTSVTLQDCTSQTDNGYIWDDGKKTFDSCYFSKSLTIKGTNVTITRSQIHGVISTHWSNDYDFHNLTLTDVEIEDEGNSGAYLSAVAGHNFSCLRCDVHHTGTGIHVGNNAVVKDSYTHDFNYTEGAHGTGIGAGQGHGNNAKVIHNNIQCNRLAGQATICSSALSLYDEPTIDNVLVQNNLFNTTGGYCVYGGGSNGTNIRFIDNYFGKKFNPECAVYGPVAVFYSTNSGNVWTGNKWQDGSGTVNTSSDL